VNYSDNIHSESEIKQNSMANNRGKISNSGGFNLVSNDNNVSETNRNKQPNSTSFSRQSTAMLLKNSMSNSSIVDLQLRSMKEYKVIDIDYAI
jgi:hypothetical protein